MYIIYDTAILNHLSFIEESTFLFLKKLLVIVKSVAIQIKSKLIFNVLIFLS